MEPSEPERAAEAREARRSGESLKIVLTFIMSSDFSDILALAHLTLDNPSLQNLLFQHIGWAASTGCK